MKYKETENYFGYFVFCSKCNQKQKLLSNKMFLLNYICNSKTLFWSRLGRHYYLLLVIVVVIIAVMRRQYVQVASQSQKVYSVQQPAQPTCNAFIVHHVSDIGFDYEVVVVVVAAVLTFAIALTLLSLPAIIIIAAFLLMLLLWV